MTDLIWHINDRVIPAALDLLPGRMNSLEARAMLLAIGLQESKFQHRRQVNGPAHSFWQFEQAGGVAGVLSHPMTASIITPICDFLLYPTTTLACYTAIEHNDVLAACFARLLLWTDSRPLPLRHQEESGWQIYYAQWRPGKPHPQTWHSAFVNAWQIVSGT